MREYQDLVQQVLDDMLDLRAAVEYDEEFMGGVLIFVDELETGIRQLLASMAKGEYQFSEHELPFMAIVRNTDAHLLPFKNLLMLINYTHTKGLTS